MKDVQQSLSPEERFEVEVSALEPAGEGNASPGVGAPLGQGLSRPARAKRLLLVAGALLAALLVFVSVPSLRGQALGLFGGSASPTTHAVSSLRLISPSPQPGPGWSQAGPHSASSIAFASSVPTTAYTCGPQSPSSGQLVPLIVGVTRDAGLIWQTLSTPATGMSCNLTVNPTNVQDVVLIASPANQCASSQSSVLYRSLDGGAHWSIWPLPSPGPNQSAVMLCYQWVWVGSTLYIAPFLPEDVAYARLAASVAGQAFVWVQPEDFLTGAPSYAGINALFATGSTLYVELTSQTCIPTCYWFSRETAAGWSRFAPTAQEQSVMLLGTGADSQTLLGEIVDEAPPDRHTYLISTDGGATWRALAPRPDLLVAGAITAAPDGAVFAAFEQDPDSPTGEQGTTASVGIYALAPGASAWQYAAAIPPGLEFVVAWDAAGHPTALWAQVDPNALFAGLERHQL